MRDNTGAHTQAPVRTDSRTVPGPHGDIPIRIYIPPTPRPEPVGVVWCHGGAFSYGDLDMGESDWVATRLAEAGIMVVAVDYRLAPVGQQLLELGAEPGTGTSPYPVATDEITTVLQWAQTELNAHSPGGWALGGASAGGTLTAAVTRRLRDSGSTLPRRLLLAYPLLHATLPPYRQELADKLADKDIILTREVVQLISLNYVNGEEKLLTDPTVFPGGGNVDGFPPTCILHADIDTLRSSSESFAADLAGAGVDLLAIREEGTEHGYLNEPAAGAHRSIQRMIAWLTVN
jgi:acetyl esterase/lipase